MKKVIYITETLDVDDILSVAVLSTSDKIDLKGIIVTPGSDEQIGFIKSILTTVNKEDIPIVNCSNIEINPRERYISPFLRGFVRKKTKAEPHSSSNLFLHTMLEKHPDINIICGAPLTAIYNYYNTAYITDPRIISNLIITGGYSHLYSEGKRKQILDTSYNLSRDREAALDTINISSKRMIKNITMVSKNICHKLFLRTNHLEPLEPRSHQTVKLLKKYINSFEKTINFNGKKMHDLTAYMFLIHPEVFLIKNNVVLHHKKQEYEEDLWGIDLVNYKTNLSITIDINKKLFFKNFLGGL